MMAAAKKKADPRRSIRNHLRLGLALSAFLVFGVGGWAATTRLSGAVIAPGQLVVESNVKKVQHPTGGIIGELRVQNGSQVKAGDIVARLDETVTRANLAIVISNLNELRARQARLEAERDGIQSITFAPELVAQAGEPEIGRLLTGERRLFETRRISRQGQKAQLNERIGQLKEQIQGLSEQIGAKKREVELIKQELEGVRNLWRQNLIPIQRVTALERDAARLEGERGALISSIAQVKGRITETELQVLQIDQDLRTEVGKELAEVRGKLSELVERRVAAEDQLRRIDIRAPQDGTVHQLSVHTIGGVITPGEPIMLIVPHGDALTVEVRVMPQEIDQLRLGQNAILRFPAFNQQTTPELNGEVYRVSADVEVEPKTGASFYTARIALTAEEVNRLGGMRLVPGMPVEAFIQTGERTVISYLTKPMTDQMMKAFREK